MRARSAGVAALAVLALDPEVARGGEQAVDPLVVRIAAPECAASPAFAAFVSSLQVELAGKGPPCCAIEAGGGRPSNAPATVTIEPCDPGAAEIEVWLEDRARARSIHRRVSLADVQAPTRPRALALAVAELLRAEGEETSHGPGPPGRGRARTAVGIGAQLRLYPALPATLWGGRLTLSRVGDRWRTEINLGAATGNKEFEIGNVTTRVLDLGLAAGPRLVLERWALDLSLCGEIGWASVVGEPARPEVLSGSGSQLVGAIGARVGVEGPLHLVRLRTGIQVGETVHGLTGDVGGRRATGVSGAFVGFSLGVSWLDDGS
jgi:hypothetical protein